MNNVNTIQKRLKKDKQIINVKTFYLILDSNNI